MCIPILLNLVVLAFCYPIGARSDYRSSGLVAYGRLKTIELLKPTTLKVVAVAYEKCSLTRGSEYSEFTWKILVFRISGRLQEVVAQGGSIVYRPL